MPHSRWLIWFINNRIARIFTINNIYSHEVWRPTYNLGHPGQCQRLRQRCIHRKKPQHPVVSTACYLGYSDQMAMSKILNQSIYPLCKRLHSYGHHHFDQPSNSMGLFMPSSAIFHGYVTLPDEQCSKTPLLFHWILVGLWDSPFLDYPFLDY